MIKVTASIGIAFAPDHGEEAGSLLRAADLAMYRAKRLGLGVPAVYSDSMGQDQVERWTTLTELREALETDQLVLHYQPLLDLRDGTVTSVEALARWNHPTHGLLAAELFMPIAEQAGLAARISVWALEQAAAQLTRWRDAGHLLQVAVNVPAQLVERPGFVQQAHRRARPARAAGRGPPARDHRVGAVPRAGDGRAEPLPARPASPSPSTTSVRATRRWPTSSRCRPTRSSSTVASSSTSTPTRATPTSRRWSSTWPIGSAWRSPPRASRAPARLTLLRRDRRRPGPGLPGRPARARPTSSPSGSSSAGTMTNE